jgi:putative ABC transport system permease protein
MLGVIIGVAAVIAMVSLGSGARGSVETSLKSAGTNIIQVSAGNFTRGGESMNIASGLGSATTLTIEDAEAIRGIAGVQHVAGGVRNRAFVKSSHRQFFTQVRGAEPSLAEIHGWEWLGGSFGTAADAAVMGRAAARELFGEGFDAVGEHITIGDRTFTVTDISAPTIPTWTKRCSCRSPQDRRCSMRVTCRRSPCRSSRQGRRAASPKTSPTLLRERHGRGRQAARATGLGGNQLAGRHEQRRRLHRQDAGGRERDERALHIGGGVRARQHAEAR